METLDREAQDSYTLAVAASDLGVPPKSSVMTLLIQVTDENDNFPVFSQNESSAYIIEKSPVDSVIALLTATDEDLGENGTVSYFIQPSNVSKYFKIDSDGLVRIKEQIIINTLVENGIIHSNETADITLNLTVTASDHCKTNPLSTDIELQVHLEPINDNAPDFEESLYIFDQLLENQPIGNSYFYFLNQLL